MIDSESHRRCAGLVLCGGRSSRLGQDKAGLRFGRETLLERVLRQLGAVVGPVLVSLPHHSPDPLLRSGTETVRDELADQGPLLGLLAGFRALRGRADSVVCAPVDSPFLTETWIARLAAASERAPAVLYQAGRVPHALSAAYRLTLLPKLERLVSSGSRRPLDLSEGEPRIILSVEDFWNVKQEPPPLADIDTLEDYREALRWDGSGDADGAAISVLWRSGAGDEFSLPLYARTPEQAIALAGRVLPDQKPWLDKSRERGQARRIGPEGEAVLDWNSALRSGDRIRVSAG